MYHELHTDEMKKFSPSTPDTTLNTVFALRRAEEGISTVRGQTEDSCVFEQIREVVETDYDIGTLEEVYQIFGGAINLSYGIYVRKDGERHTWFFRKYMRHKDMNELMMEHTLLLYAKEQGFDKSATPIAAKSGLTYTERDEENPDGTVEKWYYAVYNYIPGFQTYDWINNDLSETAYRDCAKIYADFHNAVRDFDPKTYSRAENNINVLMDEFPRDFQRYIQSYKENGYVNSFSDNFERSQPYIAKMCEKAKIPAQDFAQLPVIPCQCDPHPMNFKYNADGTASGMFDFDWAKMEVRLFEIGFASSYFMSPWDHEATGDTRDGNIKVEGLIDFVTTYNNRLKELGGLTPLTDLEKKYYFESVIMGVQYLIRWASEACFKDTTLNPYEYLLYMQHEIRTLGWLEKHEAEVREFSAKF